MTGEGRREGRKGRRLLSVMPDGFNRASILFRATLVMPVRRLNSH